MLIQDPDGLLALDEPFPAPSSEGFGAHHLSETPHLEGRRSLIKRSRVRVFTHEREHEMVVRVEDIHGQLLIPRLENMKRQEGLREEHDLGQGEEGENGW
jgi:hypothetical protein